MFQTGLEAPCRLGRTPSPPLSNPKVIPCALPSCQGALSSHSLEGSPDSFLGLSVTWWVELEAEEQGPAFLGGLVGEGCPAQWPHCLAWSSEVWRFWDSTYGDRLLRSWRHFCVHCCVFFGGGASFYRSLLSDQKPLSSALMGCPRAQETLPLRVGRPGKEGVIAAPTSPAPRRNKPGEGKELSCGCTFQQSLHLRVRQTWLYTLVLSPRN